MSKRKQWISLILLISLLITIDAGAETSLPGQITMMSYSDGELYFQVETYPTASIYRCTPATMQQPELIRNDFQAEQDIVFVVHGICYLWNGSDALIAKDESGERISLHIQEMSQRGKNYMPFLVSVCSENTLTWIMSYSESLTLCHLDLATNAFKSLDMGVGLFAVQPYQEGKCLVAVTQDDGRKEILEINWDTLEKTSKGYLEANTSAIAYDPWQDVLWYQYDGMLWRYLWSGESEKVLEDLPQWPDQRAYVLDENKLVFSDGNNLMTLELPALMTK